MATSAKRNSNHVYDYVIVGAGLSGLCVASALSKVSENILLLDSSESFGGLNRSVESPLGPQNNGLRFIPDSELSRRSISFLESILGTQLNPQHIENPVITYESGGFRPFIGYGNNTPAYFDELSYYTAPNSLILNLAPHEWTPLLFNQFNGDFSPRSIVTKFIASETPGERLIDSLLVNGQRKVRFRNLIYCGPVKDLARLLPSDALSSKSKRGLSKHRYTTALCLDLMHAQPPTENVAIHMLEGTTQDELGPCVGKFSESYSQWITFLDSEEAEDTEIVGHALKKIKRQIKRAYPNALEGLLFERILVAPDFSGNGDIRLSGNQTLTTYPNFWIGSGTISKQKNLLGTLAQAELITAAMGCHPLGHQVETLDETPQNDMDLSITLASV